MLISDQGREFVNKVNEEFMALSGTVRVGGIQIFLNVSSCVWYLLRHFLLSTNV